jgi:hypothetical protein
MKSFVAMPDSASLSDAAVVQKILDRAKELDLPLQPDYLTITRQDGKPQVKIARYSVQMSLARMDLRMPAAQSR